MVLEASLDDRTGQAHTLSLLASAEIARGDALLAATLQGASEALLRSVPTSLMEPFRPQHAASVDLAVASLGTERYGRAFDAGLAMEPPDIVEYAVTGRLPERRPAKPNGAREASHAPLSTREMEVARLVADGATNAQVAARLFISERTVESHVASAMNKLSVDSRVRVARWVATVEARGEPSH
jgi:non-specific serine/threonine protein kinase